MEVITKYKTKTFKKGISFLDYVNKHITKFTEQNIDQVFKSESFKKFCENMEHIENHELVYDKQIPGSLYDLCEKNGINLIADKLIIDNAFHKTKYVRPKDKDKIIFAWGPFWMTIKEDYNDTTMKSYILRAFFDLVIIYLFHKYKVLLYPVKSKNDIKKESHTIGQYSEPISEGIYNIATSGAAKQVIPIELGPFENFDSNEVVSDDDVTRIFL